MLLFKSMKKRFIILSTLVVLVAACGLAYTLTIGDKSPPAEAQESAKLKIFKDEFGKVSLTLPDKYEVVPINSAPADGSKSSVVLQLQRSAPQAFVIVQHDTGVGTAAAMARQNILEYMENTIRQFYPVRYGSSYKSESLERTKADGKEAIEHIYTYTDKDGNPNKVKLLAILWSQDEVYNIILQSHASNFESIKEDIESAKTTFEAPH